MLCFIEPDNINKVYKKILKKYNKKEFDVFYNYFNRTWKNKSKKKNIKFIPEFNYFKILNSLNFDIKYLFITNNIAEHINKLLNVKLNSKFPIFSNWKNAFLNVEKEINDRTEYIERSNNISNVLLYFIYWNKNNKNNSDLLTCEDIKKINTLMIPTSNIGNYIPFSEYFNLKKDDNIIKELINDIEEDVYLSDNFNSDKNNNSADEENFDENISNDNIDNRNIFDNLGEEKDLSYNVQ